MARTPAHRRRRDPLGRAILAPRIPPPPREDAAPGSRCTDACRTPSPNMAHCAAPSCHRTFGSVGGFDRHRRGGTCLDPATLGMVERDGVWRTPMSDESRERIGRPT